MGTDDPRTWWADHHKGLLAVCVLILATGAFVFVVSCAMRWSWELFP